MLSHAEAELVRRDRGLPGLASLLDDAALGDRLGGVVRRNYLRYKPATSCVLGGVAMLPGGPTDIFAVAYGSDAPVKLAKLTKAAPPGAVLHIDAGLGIAVAVPAADRDLPLLAGLQPTGASWCAVTRLLGGQEFTGATVRVLSYKPMRRWVGLVTPAHGDPVVVRVYRPGRGRDPASAVRALEAAAVRTPRWVAGDPAKGVVVVEYAPGTPLPELLERGIATEEHCRAAGRALAAVHEHRTAALQPRGCAARAVRVAAAQLGILLPELGQRAVSIAEETVHRLAEHAVDESTALTSLHGDFSADQLVFDPAGVVTVLDLDNACLGPAGLDLGSLAAARIVEQVGRPAAGGHQLDLAGLVAQGYAQVRPLPAPAAVAAHTAEMLVRRAAEPFRSCAPGWAGLIGELLDAAENRLTQAAPQ